MIASLFRGLWGKLRGHYLLGGIMNICGNEECYHDKDAPKCHKLIDADRGYDSGRVQCWWWQAYNVPLHRDTIDSLLTWAISRKESEINTWDQIIRKLEEIKNITNHSTGH